MMIHLSDKCRYLYYNGNADMRKSFHGLAAIVKYQMQCDVLNGDIYIFISKKDNALYTTVEDNGVGRDMSKLAAQPMLLKKESLGMKLTEERLKILNELKKVKAQFSITDLFTNDKKAAGTKVELSLPLAS